MENEAAFPDPMVGKMVDLRFKALDGREVDVSKAARQGWCSINFWGMWSKPSEEEMSYVRSAYRRFNDKGLEVIGVSVDSPQARGRRSQVLQRTTICPGHSISTARAGTTRAGAKPGCQRSADACISWTVKGRARRATRAGELLMEEVKRLLGNAERGQSVIDSMTCVEASTLTFLNISLPWVLAGLGGSGSEFCTCCSN